MSDILKWTTENQAFLKTDLFNIDPKKIQKIRLSLQDAQTGISELPSISKYHYLRGDNGNVYAKIVSDSVEPPILHSMFKDKQENVICVKTLKEVMYG